MGMFLTRLARTILKDLDLYAVVIISLVVAVLSVIGSVALTTVVSVTLAILALLAFSILKNRQTDDAIKGTLDAVITSLTAKYKIYPEQVGTYRFLESYVEAHPVTEAVMLQYSCTTAMPLLRTLLKHGAQVTLYVQDDSTALHLGSQEQSERISHTIKGLRGDLAGLYDARKLAVRKYLSPGSVSAVKIDNTVLAMGWYTYEHVDTTNQNTAYPDDRFQVSGHDIAAIVVWKGTPEFEALDRTFRLLADNYQRNSVTVPFA